MSFGLPSAFPNFNNREVRHFLEEELNEEVDVVAEELNESFSPTSRSARGSFHVEVLDEE